MWVIHKKSRSPGQASYAGKWWDEANMRDDYQPTYRDKKQAEILACYLSRKNPEGFKVSRQAKEIETTKGA
jgi:hypothetical protein